jgi:hypothetical protein
MTQPAECTPLEAPPESGGSVPKLLLHCPFCGGRVLHRELWHLEVGAVEAVECADCGGSAPVEAWSTRASPWIDYSELEPTEGQTILAYIVIPTPLNGLDAIGKDRHIRRRRMRLSGPIILTVEKKYIAKGWHRTPAYWQPINGLPGSV